MNPFFRHIYYYGNRGGGNFTAEYQSVLDKATAEGWTAPSSGVQSIHDTAMASLKSGSNNFSKHDALWVFGNDCGASGWNNTELDFGRINWIDPSKFLADFYTFSTVPKNLGVEGNAGTAYVNTNFTPSTDAVKLSLNNTLFWVYLTRDPIATSAFEVGANNSSNAAAWLGSAFRSTTNEMAGGINQTGSGNTSSGGSVTSVKNKLAVWVRSASNQWSGYIDGVLIGTVNATATTLPTRAIQLLCRDNNGARANFSDARILAAGFADATVNIAELKATFDAMRDALNSGDNFNPEIPLTIRSQDLASGVPVGSKYRFDGLFAKSPVTGNLAATFDQGSSHPGPGVFSDIIVVISDDDFATIGSQKTVFAKDVDGDITYTNPSVGYDANGRLHVLATKIECAAYTRLGIFGKYSDDDGDTWSAEVEVTGLPVVGQTAFNTYSPIMEIGSGLHAGTLICNLYNIDSGVANMQILRSTDNGATWEYWFTYDENGWSASTFVDNPNESDIIWLDAAKTQALIMSRCNGRSYFNQYLIDFSLSTPSATLQGRADFGDAFFINPESPNDGVLSRYSHPIRGDRFTIDGVDVVAVYYLSRYRGTHYHNAAWNVVYAKVSDLIANGVDGWVNESRIRVIAPETRLTDRDGYFCIRHTAGDLNALVLYFNDTSDNTVTDIKFGSIGDDHLDWLKSKLGI